MSWNEILPLIFMAVMGLSLLAYVVLDGYDLGVGILLPFADNAEKDIMVSSIGPFWDANETWLVLGIGVLLVAFPKAHGMVLSALYLPVAVMLIGLILRGVSFDFRVKARAERKTLWNRLFALGSLMAAMAQGWMLGAWLTGESERWRALHVTLGYLLAGLLVFRVAYGLAGPRQVRLGVLWRKLQGAPAWLRGLGRPGAAWRAGAPLLVAANDAIAIPLHGRMAAGMHIMHSIYRPSISWITWTTSPR